MPQQKSHIWRLEFSVLIENSTLHLLSGVLNQNGGFQPLIRSNIEMAAPTVFQTAASRTGNCQQYGLATSVIFSVLTIHLPILTFKFTQINHEYWIFEEKKSLPDQSAELNNTTGSLSYFDQVAFQSLHSSEKLWSDLKVTWIKIMVRWVSL